MNVVEFPGLWGLKIHISRVAFSLFGYDVYWYGIIISFALVFCLFLALRSAPKYDIDKNQFIDMLMYAVPSSIILARLYYVAFKWEDFSGSLRNIINIRSGGLAIYGAVVGAIVSCFVFTKIKKIPTMKMFDFCAVYLALGQAIGRWGNFFNQEAFGRNTTLPWGMKSETISRELEILKHTQSANVDTDWLINPMLPVHPTFLYESIWNLLLFFFLLYMRRKKKFEGEIFALYMAGYGLGRFFIEGLRTDSLMFGSIRISQLLAILFFVVFVSLILERRKKVEVSGR